MKPAATGPREDKSGLALLNVTERSAGRRTSFPCVAVRVPSAVASRVLTKFQRVALDFGILAAPSGRDAATGRQFEPCDAAFHAFQRQVSLQASHEGLRARPRVRRHSSLRDQYSSHFVSRFGFRQGLG